MKIILDTDTGEGFAILQRGLSAFGICETGGGNTERVARIIKDIKNCSEESLPVVAAEVAELIIAIKQLRLLKPEQFEAVVEEVDRRLQVFNKYITKREQFNKRVHGKASLDDKGSRKWKKRPRKGNTGAVKNTC